MSFRLKTILGVAVIEAILLLLLVYTVLNYMNHVSEQSLQTYAETTGNLFVTTTKNAVLSNDLASLETFVQEIVTNKEIAYAKVLSAAGKLLAAAGRPDLLQRPFTEDRDPQHVQDGYYDIGIEIAEAGQVYGRIQLGISNQVATQLIREARSRAISIALIEMLLVALFSLALGTYLTRQLKKIQRAAHWISEGDYVYRTPVEGSDEIAEVGEAFNKMSEQLQLTKAKRDDYQHQLEILNTELEDRVARRTAQLHEKNDLLTQAYEQLKITQTQLIHAEKLSSLGQLAAGVAHEINNPIAYIKGNLSILNDYLADFRQLVENCQGLLEHPELPNDIKSALSRFMASADFDYMGKDSRDLVQESLSGVDKVTHIVQSLREFARQDKADFEEDDLNLCIESTYKIVQNQLKYKCDVSFELGTIPRFHFNRGKISQVLINLLMNAGQSIKTKGDISISSHVQGRYAQIRIADTGEGIPEENLERLFDPFFTTKPVGEGTGLGLAIAHGIVQEHGGHITVVSTVGQGTTFTISLPLDTPTPQAL